MIRATKWGQARDNEVEPDETVTVSIDSVSEAATIGTPSTVVTITNDDIEFTDGTSGDDDIFTPLGGTNINLISGKDTVRGPVSNFFEDVIDGFSLDDKIKFEGQIVKRSDINIEITAGLAIIAIDTDDSETPKGSFNLRGDFSGGDFMAVGSSTDTLITFEDFLPNLRDNKAVDRGLVNGIINQEFLTGDGSSTFQVKLRDLGFAAHNNVVGVYEIDADGNIVDTRILFENANADKSAVARITDVEAGHRLGFFIVQDAADWAAKISDGDTLSFVNDSGAAAKISDGSDISIAVNDAAADEMVFHSFSKNMNSDGVRHTLSGVDVGGETITVGFEDVTGGGDRDYEDVAFRVAIVNEVMFA